VTTVTTRDDSGQKTTRSPGLVTLRNAVMTAALLRRAVQGRLKIAGSADFDAFVSSWLRADPPVSETWVRARHFHPFHPANGRPCQTDLTAKYPTTVQRRLVSDLLATPSPSTGGRQGAVSGWSGGILRGAFKALFGEAQLKQSPLPYRRSSRHSTC
jgi:hypothetical protein